MTTVFANVRLRANPGYRAVAWNRLAPEVGRAMSPEADSFGVLVPQEGFDLPLVAVDLDTALLFLSLQEAGPAPDFLFAMNEKDADRVLRRLVFDTVLELEQDGRFVGGAEACAALGVETGTGSETGGLRNLSIEALKYGAALAHVNPTTVAQKLYAYNRRPATPALRRRFSDKGAWLTFLGLGREHDTRGAAISGFWSRGDDDGAWLVFTRRQPQRQRADHPCKLYIGLALEELPDCLSSVAEQLAVQDALQFKIGAGLDGLLRPDKLVAYFPTKDALLGASRALMPLIAGRAVHAVPFSAEIAPGGALSWGIDPAKTWLGDQISWRQWICEKLAGALVLAASSAVEGIAPWQFALERLRLESVNPDTFMPTGDWTGTAS